MVEVNPLLQKPKLLGCVDFEGESV